MQVAHQPPSGQLHPLPLPNGTWSHQALDFITSLPESEGKTVILTIVNIISKAVHLVVLPKLPLALETSLILFDQVFWINTIPSDVVSDCGPQFVSRVWREFCTSIETFASLSSGFHPQTNGQAERVNQEVESSLHQMTSHNTTW